MSARPERLAATNRLTEMIAVVLLGIATIGTAWCGYQSSRWNAEQQDLGRAASDLRVEANREFGLATQQVQYDANLLAQYARAVSDGDTRLQEFFRTSMMRAEFVPLLDEWQAEVEAGGSPGNLLEAPGYLDAQLGGYQETQRRAEATDLEAREASENGDDYVLMTLMLATALFFAGVTTSFKVRAARLVLLACATASIAYALSRIATLPVA
jgi:hypothetical protein